MFDWANQPFFTIITTFIFAPYFTTFVVGDPVAGQAMWGYGQAIAGGLIAILAPILGAFADVTGRRKPWIAVFQAVTVVGCVGLWWATPGQPELAPYILAAVILATIGAEFSIVFNNSLLPSLVAPERLGWMSGIGWAVGYAGGLVALALFAVIASPQTFGLATPEGMGLFGLDKASFEPERLTGPLSAAWLAVFVLPLFLWTPDGVAPRRVAPRRMARVATALAVAKAAFGELNLTLRSLPRHPNPALFLLAFMLYNNGLLAVMAFAGVYFSGVFHWGTTELGLFGIVLTIAASIGALLGGYFDQYAGSKRTIKLSVLGIVAATAGLLSVTPTSVLFVIEVSPERYASLLDRSIADFAIFGFSLVLGFFMGPMQAASRALMGRIAPPDMVGEFYGLFALSGKATAFLAPLAIAVITEAFDSQRAGLVVVLAFLVVGYLLFRPVREEQARLV
jgi:UMF1 family MFS transporter